MARLFRAGPKLGPFSKRTPERTRAHSSLAPSHVHQTTIPGIQQKTTKKKRWPTSSTTTTRKCRRRRSFRPELNTTKSTRQQMHLKNSLLLSLLPTLRALVSATVSKTLLPETGDPREATTPQRADRKTFSFSHLLPPFFSSSSLASSSFLRLTHFSNRVYI